MITSLPFEVPGGGTGLVSEDAPNSVYLAYPDSELQIEVCDPSPERGRALVEEGEITPIP